MMFWSKMVLSKMKMASLPGGEVYLGGFSHSCCFAFFRSLFGDLKLVVGKEKVSKKWFFDE